MSHRYNKWNRILSHIHNFLNQKGFILDVREKGFPNRFEDVEIGKIIRQYAKNRKVKGYFADICLHIGDNFDDFQKFINNNDWPQYKTKKP